MISLILMLADLPPIPVFMNGNRLFEMCQNTSVAECVGYVMGVSDEVDSLASEGIVQKTICMPKDVLPIQAKDVVVQYLTLHPESRHLAAPGLAIQALRQAFPCRR